MTLKDRMYRRTESGDEAFASIDVAIPSDYRRILGLIHEDTHSDVIRGCLRQYPDILLSEWLDELEELGYITSRLSADTTQRLDFTVFFQRELSVATPLLLDDLAHIERQVHAAGRALYHKGAFLSPDRLEHREPLHKGPEDTTVLIVEDDPDQLALADLRVTTAGYRVRVARNIAELVEELRTRQHPDVMLLDVMLPDGDGFETLASLRRHSMLALLPVIMLTVVAGTDNIRRGLALGADGYITKPYSKNLLAETIRAVLKQSPS
ncbi:MAG: response regulator [Candidatus Binataceae bacterium]|nr:response regulator [Candidatus Binataceae bacterium]